MKPEGWLFLGLSWGFIIGLCAFCFQRLFQTRRR